MLFNLFSVRFPYVLSFTRMQNDCMPSTVKYTEQNIIIISLVNIKSFTYKYHSNYPVLIIPNLQQAPNSTTEQILFHCHPFTAEKRSWTCNRLNPLSVTIYATFDRHSETSCICSSKKSVNHE